MPGIGVEEVPYTLKKGEQILRESKVAQVCVCENECVSESV